MHCDAMLAVSHAPSVLFWIDDSISAEESRTCIATLFMWYFTTGSLSNSTNETIVARPTSNDTRKKINAASFGPWVRLACWNPANVTTLSLQQLQCTMRHRIRQHIFCTYYFLYVYSTRQMQLVKHLNNITTKILITRSTIAVASTQTVNRKKETASIRRTARLLPRQGPALPSKPACT